MSSITASTDMDKVTDDDLSKYAELFFSDVVRVVNGGLDFQTNFNCKLVSITFGAFDTDTSIAHGLGRVPAGYIVTSSTAATGVYNGSIASTSSNLTLRSSNLATVGLIIF